MHLPRGPAHGLGPRLDPELVPDRLIHGALDVLSCLQRTVGLRKRGDVKRPERACERLASDQRHDMNVVPDEVEHKSIERGKGRRWPECLDDRGERSIARGLETSALIEIHREPQSLAVFCRTALLVDGDLRSLNGGESPIQIPEATLQDSRRLGQ